MKRYAKTIVALAIIVTTLAAFVYYLAHHPNTIARLRELPPLTVLGLLGLYGGMFLALSVLSWASLRLYGKRIGMQENILFNAYSSLINFFGPGQSGPIFRGAYLKKRHNLGVKQYLFATLLYYGCYAICSAFLLFAGTRPWWQTLALVLAAAGTSIIVIRRYKQRAHIGEGERLAYGAILWIVAATVVQVALVAIIYSIELHAVGAHASLVQVLSYTGVANLALFVSLTPGAIGIREAFLVFSQQLHHINSGVIVAANVIDRGVYLVLLGILFVIVLGLHAKDKLHIK